MRVCVCVCVCVYVCVFAQIKPMYSEVTTQQQQAVAHVREDACVESVECVLEDATTNRLVHVPGRDVSVYQTQTGINH